MTQAPTIPGIPLYPGGSSSQSSSYIPPNNAGLNHQEAQFIITFIDGATSDLIWTDSMKVALQYVASQWSRMIASSIPITIEATIVNLIGLPIKFLGNNFYNRELGSSIISHSQNPSLNIASIIPNAEYPSALANALAKTDIDPNEFDMKISFASDSTLRSWSDPTKGTWHLGTDGQLSTFQYDFVTVAMHEIGHGLLGFSSFGVTLNHQGAIIGHYNTANPSLIDYHLFPCPQDSQNYVSYFGRIEGPIFGQCITPQEFGEMLVGRRNPGGVCWLSNHVFDACNRSSSYFPKFQHLTPNDGVPYPIVTTVIGHLHEDAYPQSDPNSLMTPLIKRGESIHGIGSIFLCILRQLGWSTFYEYETSPPPGDGGYDGLVSKGLVPNFLSFKNSIETPIISVFPNPARERLTINLNKFKTDHMEVIISDFTGKMIEKFIVGKDENKKSIVTSDWSSGLYIIQLVDKGQSIDTKKFTLVR